MTRRFTSVIAVLAWLGSAALGQDAPAPLAAPRRIMIIDADSPPQEKTRSRPPLVTISGVEASVETPAPSVPPSAGPAGLLAHWGHRRPACVPSCPQPCPQPDVTPPQPETTPPQPPSPAAVEPTVAPETSAAVGGDSFTLAAPNMIGDQVQGGAGAIAFFGPFVTGVIEHPSLDGQRLNIAENNSPIPRDRVFFQYNFYHKATPVVLFGSQSFLPIDAYTFGLEKTFFDCLASVEVLLPLFRQIDDTIRAANLIGGTSNVPYSDREAQIGNAGLIGKMLLWQSDTLALCGGLGLNLPTAPDVSIQLAGQTALGPRLTPTLTTEAFLRNETVNLVPFVGGIWAPSDRLFAQGFLQWDVPLNSADVAVSSRLDGLANVPIALPDFAAKYHQQTWMRVNVGGGFWAFQDDFALLLTGFAPQLEVHTITSLNNPDIVRGPGLHVGDLAGPFTIVNLTMGGTFEFGSRMTLAAAAVVPLTQGDDRWFDYEVNIQLNWRFGPQTRLSRVAF